MKYWTIISNRLTTVITAFLVIQFSWFILPEGFSQVHINSPYSKFGPGLLFEQNTTQQLSMGGVSTALFMKGLINPSNPAANYGIDTMSFVFNGGIHSHFGKMATDESSSPSRFISLGYLLFGFPVNKWLKTSIGLMPYSNVGYKITESRFIPLVGKTEYYYQGSGGVNEVLSGFSVSPLKRLSVGFKVSYLFGKSTRSASLFFPDSVGLLSTKIDHDTEVGDLYFSCGLQYHWKLPDNQIFGIGVAYSPDQFIRTKRDYLVRSFFYSVYGVESFRDTVDMQKGKGNTTIPEKFSAGVMWKKDQKWLVAADVSWQKWSEYRAFERSDSLQNSLRISLGGEYLPAKTALDSYWKNIRYRFGVNYQRSHLNLYNQSIDDFGISFGVGLPLPRTSTTINLGIMAGNFGTKRYQLIQERYVMFNVGVSVLEKWFVQSRYY